MDSKHINQVLQDVGHQSVIRTRDFAALGVSRGDLGRLVMAGRLNHLSRGLYTLPGQEPASFQSYAEVAARAPRSIICLLSALRFHEIGTQAPFEVWIVLPAGTHSPRLTNPKLRIIRVGKTAFLEGCETHQIANVPVRIYSPACTIASCFKFRNKVGLDVALEALKDAWHQKKVTMDALWHYAKINRVANVMRPYLEALTT